MAGISMYNCIIIWITEKNVKKAGRVIKLRQIGPF